MNMFKDPFNTQKVFELEQKLKLAQQELFSLRYNNFKESAEKFFSAEVLFSKAKKSDVDFKKVSDIDKIKYDLDYPRKYNIGDVYNKLKCYKVDINTQLGGLSLNRHEISGRTYYFKEGNISMEIFEPKKTV